MAAEYISVKILTTIYNQAKEIKKITGVPIGKQFEMSFTEKNKKSPKSKTKK